MTRMARFALSGALVLVLAPAGVLLQRTSGAAARAVAATRRDRLSTAIGLLREYNSPLLQPNRPISLGGQHIQPAFTRLRYVRSEQTSLTKLTGSLVKGE